MTKSWGNESFRPKDEFLNCPPDSNCQEPAPLPDTVEEFTVDIALQTINDDQAPPVWSKASGESWLSARAKEKSSKHDDSVWGTSLNASRKITSKGRKVKQLSAEAAIDSNKPINLDQ